MKLRHLYASIVSFLLLLSLGSTGVVNMSCSGSGGTCDPIAETGCSNGQVCEEVQGGQPSCFSPVTMSGTITNASTGQPIQNARVVALDANGSAVSDVAITDSSGNYQLTVSSARNSAGTPVDKVTLRADAAGFQTSPLVVPPFPLDLSLATQSSGGFTFDNNLTDLHLNPLPGGAGTASISGTVKLPQGRTSVLVVAELNVGTACPALPNSDCTSIAGKVSGSTSSDGSFSIFNLPAGNYTVKGFVNGTEYNSVPINLLAGQNANADLTIKGSANGTLNGKVNFVNATGNITSVILVLESTLIEEESTKLPGVPVLIRGALPPGLRVENVGGDFTLTGVPEGKYVILAAFEDDGLVRDPDTCIAGTDILHQSFTSGQTVSLSNPFKVTGSLGNPNPDANEIVNTLTPTFSWDDDSSEDRYVITVFDHFGSVMWDAVVLEGGFNGGQTASIPYNSDGTAIPLQSGQFYQFHVFSVKNGTGSPQCSTDHAISQTEDLRGVFQEQ
jgi:hypothetical protein